MMAILGFIGVLVIAFVILGLIGWGVCKPWDLSPLS